MSQSDSIHDPPNLDVPAPSEGVDGGVPVASGTTAAINGRISSTSDVGTVVNNDAPLDSEHDNDNNENKNKMIKIMN